MDEYELLEYGIYHSVLGRGTNLPGILSSGMPSREFFSSRIASDSYTGDEITEWLDSTFVSWHKNRDEQTIILGSGGVDSSALIATACQAGRNFKLLHTSYIKHGNNDLTKLINLLEVFASEACVFSIGPHEYLEGLEILWKHGIPQNTYGPTLAFTMSKNPWKNSKELITGSGPDELFYGMEKYSFAHFNSIHDLDLVKSIGMLDTSYNLEANESVLNDNGRAILNHIKSKRQQLYVEIASQSPNIYEAQRLLAYCTVTTQHIAMFDEIASLNGMNHYAPFLDPELVSAAFSTSIMNLIDSDINASKVEIGKKHLKQFLKKFMSTEHVDSKKIGFHAPVTNYMYSTLFENYFKKIKDGCVPDIYDMDKLNLLLSERLRLSGEKIYIDYFLYSILNISRYMDHHGSS